MDDKLMRSGVKYGALAGFICAEVGLGGMAAVYGLGGVFGYGPPIPEMGIAIFLLGQLMGALPATIVGVFLGGVGGLLFSQFPLLLTKGRGLMMGLLYALGMYLLLDSLFLLFGGRAVAGYELFSLLFAYAAAPSRTTPDDFLLSYLAVFILYLCAGAWVGFKMAKIVQASSR